MALQKLFPAIFRAEETLVDASQLEPLVPRLALVLKASPAYLRQITYKSVFVSFELLRTVRPSTFENVLLTPIGLAIPLVALGAGASGVTENEIKTAMRWELVPWNFCVQYYTWAVDHFLISRQVVPDQLFLSAHVIIRLDSKLNEKYAEIVRELGKYHVLHIVNNQSLVGLEKYMNEYFKLYTRGLCPNVMPANFFTEETKCAVISLCYVKPQWRVPFQKRLTVEKPFFLSPGKMIKVPFMITRDLIKFNEDLDMKMCGLYVKGTRFVLYMVIPKKVFGLHRLEGKVYIPLTKLEKFFELVEKAAETDLILEIPRFHLQFMEDITDKLRSFNLNSMFDKPFADFSNLSNSKIHVDKVFQYVGLNVFETGIDGHVHEGAMYQRCGTDHLERPPFLLPKEFIANQPFLVLLLDRESNSLYQIGRVSNPIQDPTVL